MVICALFLSSIFQIPQQLKWVTDSNPTCKWLDFWGTRRDCVHLAKFWFPIIDSEEQSPFVLLSALFPFCPFFSFSPPVSHWLSTQHLVADYLNLLLVASGCLSVPSLTFSVHTHEWSTVELLSSYTYTLLTAENTCTPPVPLIQFPSPPSFGLFRHFSSAHYQICDLCVNPESEL